MKYVIMCGTADYMEDWPDYPKHLSEVNGEVIIERTIRLLKECGVKDICITSNDTRFANYGVDFVEYNSSGIWYNGFYNFQEPACYIFGDVYYSYTVISTIVNKHVDNIEFFASNEATVKEWAEPYGFKVVNYKKFFECTKKATDLYNEGKTYRYSAWELWQVIKGTTLNKIRYNNYTAINDYSCDIDYPDEIEVLESKLSPQKIMIHAIPDRLWYVYDYIIPSLEKQNISNIRVWVDWEKSGNLQACLKSFKDLPDDGITWHLQDDILISRKFAEVINNDANEITCGFASRYDKFKDGIVHPKEMWFSFPCIKIPNKYAKEFIKWCNPDTIKDEKILGYIKENKYDDSLFKDFLILHYPDMEIMNLKPNIVNHVDWLIGGSATNPERYKIARKVTSRLWAEPGLVHDLEHEFRRLGLIDNVDGTGKGSIIFKRYDPATKQYIEDEY